MNAIHGVSRYGSTLGGVAGFGITALGAVAGEAPAPTWLVVSLFKRNVPPIFCSKILCDGAAKGGESG